MISLPSLELALAIIKRDHARHFSIPVDHTISLARCHALGAGIDECLEFGLEGDFTNPLVAG